MLALQRGLTLRDFHDLTIGMIFDYIVEYDNLHSDAPRVRQAGQDDFDRF